MGEGKADYERRKQMQRAAEDLARERTALSDARNDLAEETAIVVMEGLRDFFNGKASLEVWDGNTPGHKSVRFSRD